MKPLPKFIAVIHIKDIDQAIQQTIVTTDNGVDGVFLIDHKRTHKHLTVAYAKVRNALPNYWIGLNFLDLYPRAAFVMLPQSADGLWLDSVEGFDVREIPENRSYRVFAGAAFKYQPQPSDNDLELHTKAIADVYDVATTSGPGTGEAADLQKIIRMKTAIGSRPLAIASGITAENIRHYLPYVDSFLVATGISKSFTELDPEKVQQLSMLIREYNRHQNDT